MTSKFDTRFGLVLALAEGLELVAQDAFKAAKKKWDGRKPRAQRGTTLRPSGATPMWNTVAAMVKPHLKKRGDRANLARELGVHRARIGEYFDQKTAMPDAERTLQLLLWLASQKRLAKAKTGEE